MINQKWKASLKNAKTRPGADCNSDHQLLIVDMQFRLKKLPVAETPLKLNYNSIDEVYQVKISNSFEALLASEEEKSPNELWEDGKKTILSVAKSTIPKKRKKKKQWISSETLKEVEKRRLLTAKGIRNEVDKAKYRKKGDIQQCNVRTIALMGHCIKVILKIIAGRMREPRWRRKLLKCKQALDQELEHEAIF